MKEMLIMISTITPVEDLIERLEEALQDYKTALLLGKPSEEEGQRVVLFCQMIIINQTTKGDLSNVPNMINDMNMVGNIIKDIPKMN